MWIKIALILKLSFRRYLLLIYIFFSCTSGFSQTPLSVCTWNLKDFGRSKSNIELAFIAKTVAKFDIVAIQEVVAGYGGAQAVAALVDQLNRSGSKWDYVVSDPTSGSSYKTERYAFLWKPSRVRKLGRAWLEAKYALLIDREPYYCRFTREGKIFTLVNFHAITKAKQPETEIKYLKYLPSLYPKDNLIFCGDFNLPQSHTVFNPLKRDGYRPALRGQKTSLKRKNENGDFLASEFDNFYFNGLKVKAIAAGIIHFYKSFRSLKDAIMISDHVPVYCNFYIL